jgi:hypothetical protein
MYCYVRNALPRVRWVCLVRLCYVFLLPCHLGSIVIVQPSFQKKVLSVLLMKGPLQTTLSLASETSKKIMLELVFFFKPLRVLPLKLHLHSL